MIRERTVPMSEFITGPGRTVCGPRELLLHLSCDALPAHGAAFEKVGHRRSLVISTVCLAALVKLDAALADTRVAGIETNLAYLRQVVRHPVFREGRQITRFLSELSYQPDTIEVLSAGVQTAVQDWPGRRGYWDVGVPPSGPMPCAGSQLSTTAKIATSTMPTQ